MTKVTEIDFKAADLTGVKLHTRLKSLPYFEDHIIRRLSFKLDIRSVEDLLVHFNLYNGFRTYRLGDKINDKLTAFCNALLEDSKIAETVEKKAQQEERRIARDRAKNAPRYSSGVLDEFLERLKEQREAKEVKFSGSFEVDIFSGLSVPRGFERG